jgi:ABC-type sulfate/molybdate transport systems ATPase subunit
VIYVTHSWPEVLEICDHLAVLIGGRIEQAGATENVYLHPVSPAAARLTGPVCEIPAKCVEASEVNVTPDARLLVEEKSDGAAYVVRPHQIQWGASSEGDGWRVAASRPSLAGWRVTLVSETGRELKIDSPRPRAPGDSVSIQLTSDVESPSLTRRMTTSAT